MTHWTYPYVYARARGFLSRMLSPSQIEDILRGDINAFKQLLLSTSYSNVATNFAGSEFSIVDFERTARQEMLKRLTTFTRGIPRYAMPLVNVEFKQFEARNIKQALRVLHLVETEEEEVSEELKKFFVPVFYPLEYYERFLELGSITRAIDVIRDRRLKNALIEVYEDYKRTREYSLLEAAIDVIIYSDLRNLAKYLGVGSGAGDPNRFQMYRLVSEKIDLVNLITIMRCILASIDFSDYLIPANFALGDEFCSILGMETVTEVLSILSRSPYREVVDQIVSGDERDALYEFEILSKRYMAKRVKSSFYVSPLSLMCFYGFLELSLYELADIMTLYVGKLNDLDPDTIKSNLTLLALYER